MTRLLGRSGCFGGCSLWRGGAFRALAAFLLVLTALSCGKTGPVHDEADGGSSSGVPSADALACTDRSDCTALGEAGAGLICGASFRCEMCISDSQCGLKERCGETGRCVFKDGFGDECVFNDDCMGGKFCVQGLCRDALSVAFCVDGGCLAQGMRCNQVNGVCEADLGCLSDDDCTKGIEVCNAPTRTCVTACTEETYQAVCRPSEVCFLGKCSACAVRDDCPPGLVCDTERLICASESDRVRCTRDEECPRSQSCDPDIRLCLPSRPPCTSDEGCGSDEVCHIASGKCIAGTCEPDRFEPNDTASMALEAGRDLSAGTFSDLTLCGGESDFYAVTLSRGDALTVQFVGDTLLAGRIHLAIADSMGRSLGMGSLSAAGTAAADGRHLISVASDERRVSYGLTIAISPGASPCGFDRFEPNDAPLSATRLSPEDFPAPVLLSDGIPDGVREQPDDFEVDGLTICGSDADYFALEVPEGFFPIVTASLASPDAAAVDVEEEALPDGWNADASAGSWKLFRAFSPMKRAASAYSLSIHWEEEGHE